MSASKRGGVRPTHEWELLLPLFEWPEQERYEEIRPMVLFDVAVAERAAEVGTSASTLYRRLDHFAKDGMESLFDAPAAKHRRLPPAVRRLIVDLKAEIPPSTSTRSPTWCAPASAGNRTCARWGASWTRSRCR